MSAPKKNNRLRNIIIVAVCLVILLIIAKKAGWIGSTALPEVEISKVGRHTIIETVNANGKLQPETEIKISADISGEIIELPIKEGMRVKKGDLLARIKPDEYQRNVEKAQAVVQNTNAGLASARATEAQSRANFEKVKLAFERNKKLYDQKAISQADYENLQSDYNIAKAQLEGAQENVKASQYTLASTNASLKESEFALSKTSIYSPMNGTISKLSVELGERVVGTMQMTGTEMMRVANLSTMEAEVEVNENDIVRLHIKDTADIEIDAFRGEKFKGLVTDIANSSATASDQISAEKVTNFKVKILLLESSYKHLLNENNPSNPTPFRPGMTADVEIHTKTASNVLAVPILSVTTRSKKGAKDSTAKGLDLNEVVYLYDKGKAVEKKVKTGVQDDSFIEIIEGIKQDETVISGPYRIVSKTLKDGDKVEKSKKPNEN
jgi:HlyD family secretion protein